ncbi:glycosyltransferase [Priestia megaterium]|uniref:glycosyltransferase n=1 Tax=Priestia megaterium TaxID=1404 RepID=UPI003D034042
MKDILIVYNTMCIGGSTTSLLSLLSNLDYEKYNVELLLSDNSGDLINLLPKQVKLLPQAYPKNLKQLKKRSFVSILKYGIGKVVSYNKANAKNIIGQIMTYENAKFSRRLTKEYDIAISFLENFPLNYVSKYVKAKSKVTWIHLDYLGAGFIPIFDRRCYRNFKKFVLVSDECLNSFNKVFPEYSDKSMVIENILISDTVKRMAKEQVEIVVDKNLINLVTVCRVSFAHKGLDRGIDAFIKLKKLGIADKFRWYIIGNGVDYNKLKNLIKANNLSNSVILVGEKKNPFPYEIQMDAFLLPSRYEGKPMAVTEAQMLGIVPIVTKYASANEQVNHMEDGIIVDNNDDAIFDVLKQIYEQPNILKVLKGNLKKNSYDNLNEMHKVMSLIEGDSDE